MIVLLVVVLFGILCGLGAVAELCAAAKRGDRIGAYLEGRDDRDCGR